MDKQSDELRFGFGKNWADFVQEKLSDKIVSDSQAHMAGLLRSADLSGKTFLDIGCGSGIHSLAAIKMGAERVFSFDYDNNSVETTRKVRAWAGSPENWEVAQGSVLDVPFMETLPKADIVYSWGVLHHTGSMWQAVKHAGIPLKSGGEFYIALYSSDNYVDPPPEYWIQLKRRYNQSGALGKKIMEFQYAYKEHIAPTLRAGRNPLALMRNYDVGRGMSYWTDVKDWLGGYPMEFASLAETQSFVRDNFGLSLVNVNTEEGCTEYVFADPKTNEHWRQIEAGREQIALSGPFDPNGGKAYMVSLPELSAIADDNDARTRSKMMVYEDGAMLGLAHCGHDDIRRYGGGRFSHWADNLYFSAPDGSDPRENGRQYSYCLNF